MKFVTVRDLRTTPAQVWKMLAEEQELVLTNNGKPIGLISSLDESNFEQTLAMVRQARTQIAVRFMQIKSVKEERSFTDAEIEAEIKAARTERASENPTEV